MTETFTAHSYLVRVYRVDTDNPSRITGLVEAMDGSGICAPFNDMDELSCLLRKGSERRRSRRGTAKPGLKSKE